MFCYKFLSTYKIDNQDSRQQELLSATITFLKFPLAVLVVILHANPLTKPIEQIGIIDLVTNYPAFSALTWFFSRFLAYLAVPSFFVISGFLLFYNVGHFNRSVYQNKMRRRIMSLVIPYITWNFIYFIFFWFTSPEYIPLYEPFDFHHESSPIKFFYELFVRPIDGPLWFIRNLFVMTLISPVFYWSAHKMGFALPLFLLCLTQFTNSSIVESLLWFSMGVSLSVMRIDFLRLCRKVLPLCFFVLLAGLLIDLVVCSHTGEHYIIGHFSIFKIMLVFGWGYWMIERHHSWSNCKVLNQSTFVIYAYHGAPLCWFLGVLFPTLINWGMGGVILGYFLSVALIIVGGVILSFFIHKSKMLTKFLTGR